MQKATLSRILLLAGAVAGCANTGSKSDGGGIHLDIGTPQDMVGGSKDMAGGAADMAMGGGGDGGGPGNCTQIAMWPGSNPQGLYDSQNMVTAVFSSDMMKPPFNVLSIEDWQTMGEMYPKNVTYMMGDKYATCEVCALMQACDAMANCNNKWFAQAGTVTVTKADRNDQMGRMTATANNLTLVEWDFSMNGDKPVPNGSCIQIGTATFDVQWNNATDGGMPVADMAGADLKGADMSMPKGDMAIAGCNPKVNEVQTAGVTASDEWVEIFNPCMGAIDMTGWKLEYRSAGNNNNGADTAEFTFNQMIPAGGYLLIVGAGYTGMAMSDGKLSNGLAGSGGAVGLRDGNANLVDSVAWNTLTAPNNFTEGMPAANPPASSSIARSPNGADTNNNSVDFKVTAMPTPRAANK